MQALARASRGIAAAVRPSAMEAGHGGQLQQARGIVVQVRDGNLDRALSIMERKMRSSGMERLIRARTHHHVKDSEKRVLARKALMQRVRSQELGKKLREILIKKIRSVPQPPHQFSRHEFLCPVACGFLRVIVLIRLLVGGCVAVRNRGGYCCARQVLDEMTAGVLVVCWWN
ncbi:uncharacterized protein C2845_PM02G01980 [Panicum miliaceum]|uniref:Ribosomal protein S21 family protein n=1 Tax=Panicum miliaceum TaxID=4540 RepID=A0A3L6S9H6_PANMI|nr:uncharacterized protein C2845_PM02G01980 [Panicum miliaceum]